MPKSRKRPQKRPHANGRRSRATHQTTADLVIAADEIVSAGGIDIPEDWQRLEDSFLAEYPVCPDCQASWDLELANQEMAPLDGEISLIVPCPAYEADEMAGRSPARHVRSSGLIHHSLSLL
jgi:hypothetical protein